jgi:hypothetical protein
MCEKRWGSVAAAMHGRVHTIVTQNVSFNSVHRLQNSLSAMDLKTALGSFR